MPDLERIRLSDDEERLVRLFRCISDQDRNEVFGMVCRFADELLGEDDNWISVPPDIDFLAADYVAFGDSDPSSPRAIFRHATNEALGEPCEYLFMTVDKDADAVAAETFVAVFDQEAMNHQPSMVGLASAEQFVELLDDWRWAFVHHCEKARADSSRDQDV